MDLIRSFDFWLLNQLATFTVQHSWAYMVVYVMAQGLIVVPVVALYVLWRQPEPISHKHGNQKAALLAVMTLFLALAAKSLIVFLWFRARPYIAHPDLLHLPLNPDPSSFPSGHTIVAFSIAFSLMYSGLKKVSSWLLFVAILIGLGRVMAGVHYPSDVIAGVLISWAAAWYLHREASSIRKFLPDH
jgi:membrane-associated phospholipid phosphatase